MASLWLTTLGQTDGLTPPLRPESNKSDAPLAAALVAGGTSVLEQIDYSMSLNHSDPKPRPRAAHIWPAHAAGFYIEPHWCSERLFAVEQLLAAFGIAAAAPVALLKLRGMLDIMMSLPRI